MHKLFLLVALIAAPLLPGCLFATAAAAGVVVSQEVIEDNTYIGHIQADVNQVWAQAKISLGKLSTEPIDVQNELRRATADVDGATVKVAVETFDLNVSVLRVSARRYGVASGDDAKIAFDKIWDDMRKMK
jgi:hypothetical protein